MVVISMSERVEQHAEMSSTYEEDECGEIDLEAIRVRSEGNGELGEETEEWSENALNHCGQNMQESVRHVQGRVNWSNWVYRG